MLQRRRRADRHLALKRPPETGIMPAWFPQVRSMPDLKPGPLFLPALLLAVACAMPAAAAPAGALATHAERSGFTETGRYEEVAALCEAFADAHPDAVRCFDFGTSPEGRPMKALAISRTGALDAAQARAAGHPVVLVQGGIHPGEADGKDAGFLALPEVLAGTAAPGSLDRLVWL